MKQLESIFKNAQEKCMWLEIDLETKQKELKDTKDKLNSVEKLYKESDSEKVELTKLR